MTARKVRVVTEAGHEVQQPVHVDMDARIEARKNEAVDEPFSFQLGGERFVMSPPEHADWRIATGLDDSNAAGLRDFVRELLGDEQFERFMEHAMPSDMLGDLIRDCQKHYGTTPGESPASKRSSRSTRRR